MLFAKQKLSGHWFSARTRLSGQQLFYIFEGGWAPAILATKRALVIGSSGYTFTVIITEENRQFVLAGVHLLQAMDICIDFVN